MAIKVVKTRVNPSKISSEIDVFEGLAVSRKEKKKIASDVADYLKTAILEEVGNTKSPLSGYSWPGLSSSYRKFKRSQNLPGKANLEFSGGMLDDFDVVVKDSGKIELNVTGSESAAKADGHNNFSGGSQLPLRRFLPTEEDTFKKNITNDVNDIVARAIGESVKLPVSRLREVSSKASFFRVLKELFPGFSESQVSDAILSNEDLLAQIRDLGLTRYLVG
jgi:hypothetical protein